MIRLLLFLSLAGIAMGGTELELKTPGGILRGTLEEPKTPDKSLVVLILPGSGPTDRDGNSELLPGKNDHLKLLAEGLAAGGISSVRIDKRGLGGSREAGPKTEDELVFETYVDDAVAWLGFLKKDQGFQRVVILGHSEGALIGLLATVKTPVTAYISVSGVAKRASALLRDQLKPKLPPELFTEATAILQQLDQGRKVAKVSPELSALFRTSAQPYLISWIQYTPTEEIAKLTVPVLIVQGTTDIQAPADSAEQLHQALPGSTLAMVPGMNHLLKAVGPDMTAQLASYSDPKLPLHPDLLAPVLKFLRELPPAR